MAVRVRTAPQARAQVRRAKEWWVRNRGAAPAPLKEELAHALVMIVEFPDIGKVYEHPEIPGLRRLLLRRTRYHIYYVHDATAHEVLVLAFWSAVRGRDPVLVAP